MISVEGIVLVDIADRLDVDVRAYGAAYHSDGTVTAICGGFDYLAEIMFRTASASGIIRIIHGQNYL